MKPVIAHNGLAYHVNLIYTVPMDTKQYHCFKFLFGNLVAYLNKINDEGMMIQFTININEEISKFGRFKDIPTKAELRKFMPIILESDTYQNSDVAFLMNLIHDFMKKERFNRRNMPQEVLILKEKLEGVLKEPEIAIKNLVLINKKP
ncbi:hypothetical protein JCM11672_00710 [Alkaliphilus crotonatoxidans]